MNTDRPQEDETAPEEQAGEPAAATQQAVVDRRGLPGWDRVAQLVEALLSTKGLCVTAGQVANIIRLWEALDPVDRHPTSFASSGLPREARGRFARRYRSGHIGVEATAR